MGDSVVAGAFYYDLRSPEAYLASERVLATLPFAAEWTPVRGLDLPGAESFEGFRCAEEESIFFSELERRADRQGIQPLRWPDPFPFDSDLALRAATYAQAIGRAVAFSLAAFRQAFAAGRDLARVENVLIAAAACEMHPTAVLAGIDLRSTRQRLEAATRVAVEAGVNDVPAVRWGERVFVGALAVERATAAHAAGGGSPGRGPR